MQTPPTRNVQFPNTIALRPLPNTMKSLDDEFQHLLEQVQQEYQKALQNIDTTKQATRSYLQHEGQAGKTQNVTRPAPREDVQNEVLPLPNAKTFYNIF